MDAINDGPRNGYAIVSTFSGCGGSCAGFKMAGFQVLMASEFIPEAQKTYMLNHPDTQLDGRDIREVSVDDVLERAGVSKGQLDVLEGSPPCSSFSVAGTGSKGWGQQKAYSDTAQRTDDLFGEYTRLLDGLQPRMFVAENVPGMVRGSSKGYFREIVRNLEACGYAVVAKILDAASYGVPQSRRRLIFVGIRNDLDYDHDDFVWPEPFETKATIGEALPNIWRVRTAGAIWKLAKNMASPTITVADAGSSPTAKFGGGGSCQVYGSREQRKWTQAELRVLCGFPADFVATGEKEYRGVKLEQWERLARSVPPPMMKAVADSCADFLKRLDSGAPAVVKTVHPLRALLQEQCSLIDDDEVAVFLSGGVDGASVGLACVDVGKKVTAYSFTLDDRESTDWTRAQRFAASFGWDFVDIQLPTSPMRLIASTKLLIELGARGKAEIECIWPFLVALEHVEQKALLTGIGADTHFILSKKGMIHFRETVELNDEFRRDSQSSVTWKRRIDRVASAAPHGQEFFIPWSADSVRDYFMGKPWDECNTPHEKQTIRDAFPELARVGITKHTNLQLGDSGIAKLFSSVLLADPACNPNGAFKSTVGVYNLLAKRLKT